MIRGHGHTGLEVSIVKQVQDTARIGGLINTRLSLMNLENRDSMVNVSYTSPSAGVRLMIDSMLDGTPTLRLNEFMLAGIEKGQIPLELPEGEKNGAEMSAPQEVVFEMDEKLKSAVAKSYQGFGAEMAQQDLRVCSSQLRNPGASS